MAASIPISKEVTVIPGVVGTGGNPLSLNGVFLTENTLAPTDAMLSFSNSADVGTYFGTGSVEYSASVCYFAGFDNSSKKPGTIYFTAYSPSARAAFLRGASLAGQSLSYFQAIVGSLSINVSGTVYSNGSLNLSSATSIGGVESTSVVSLIASQLSLGSSAVVSWDSVRSEIVINATGTGSSIAYATGTTASSLGLSGGVLSQSTSGDTPASVMNNVINLSNDWACFTTVWEPSNSDALAFGAWTQAQGDRYAYVAWDSDIGNLTANNASTLGALVAASTDDGVLVVYAAQGGQYLAAAVLGYAASIDWSALNGRATLKFRQQAGLANYVTPVTSISNANAILSNNVTYFGTYSAPGLGNTYNIIADGAMGGSKFKWFDTYISQIYLNSQLALSIFNGLLQVNMAPYNVLGYNLIRAWCADPITEGVNCGIIRSGVSLSQSQVAAINYQVGKDISVQLQTQGYYLYIADATAQTRGQRKSPPIKLFYMDGGAIQQVTLNSIVVL